MAAEPPALQPFIAGFTVPIPPEVKGGSRDSKAPTRCLNAAILLGALNNPLLSSDFSLILSHFDPPVHPVSSRSRMSGWICNFTHSRVYSSSIVGIRSGDGQRGFGRRQSPTTRPDPGARPPGPPTAPPARWNRLVSGQEFLLRGIPCGSSGTCSTYQARLDAQDALARNAPSPASRDRSQRLANRVSPHFLPARVFSGSANAIRLSPRFVPNLLCPPAAMTTY